MSPILTSIPVLALVVVLAGLAAMGFRRLGLKDGGILAGLVVGVLCGPTVIGRLAPQTWSGIVLGATEARTDLRAARSELAAWEFAVTSTELPPENLESEAIQRRNAIVSLERRVADDTVAHARPWSVALVGGATLLVMLSAIGTRPGRTRTGPIGLAAWCGVLPGLALLVAKKFSGGDPFASETLLTAACISCGSWSLSHRSRGLLRRAEADDFVIAGNRGAIVVSVGWAIGAAFVGTPAWSMILVALVPFLLPANIRGDLRRRAMAALEGLVVPGLAALAVLRVEVLLETSILLVAILTVIAGDGRALGWMMGIRFEAPPPSARVWRPWTISMLASDASRTQLGLACVVIGLGGVGAATSFGLVASAAIVQLLSPVRWGLATVVKGRRDDA